MVSCIVSMIQLDQSTKYSPQPFPACLCLPLFLIPPFTSQSRTFTSPLPGGPAAFGRHPVHRVVRSWPGTACVLLGGRPGPGLRPAVHGRGRLNTGSDCTCGAAAQLALSRIGGPSSDATERRCEVILRQVCGGKGGYTVCQGQASVMVNYGTRYVCGRVVVRFECRSTSWPHPRVMARFSVW